MVIFDGINVTSVTGPITKPSVVVLQNRSASDVYVLDSSSQLRSSINSATNIPSDGLLVPFSGSPIVHLRKFTGELFGFSPLSGGAVIVEVWPEEESC